MVQLLANCFLGMMNSAICFALLSWMLLHRGSTELLDVNCGTVSRLYNHVISDSPWMALIILPNKNCSGALIHKQFVITSANCVFNKSDSSSARQLPSNITVRLGDFKNPKLENISEEYPPKNYNIGTAYIHNSYEQKTYNNDIALLELPEDVLYKAHIRPICIWLDDIESYGDLETCLYTDVTSFTDWIVGTILEVDVVVSNLEHAYD